MKIGKKYHCAYVPSQFNYETYESEINQKSLLFTLIYKFNFILEYCYILKKSNSGYKSFPKLLNEQLNNKLFVKKWVLTYFQFHTLLSLKEKKREYVKYHFSFKKITEEILAEKESLFHFFENNETDKKILKELHLHAPTVINIYYFIEKLYLESKEKMSNQTEIKPEVELSRLKTKEISPKKVSNNEIPKENKKETKNKTHKEKMIKIKNKEYKIPISTWDKYKVCKWIDFSNLVKRVLTLKLERDIGNDYITPYLIQELKLSDFISTQEELDFHKDEHSTLINKIIKHIENERMHFINKIMRIYHDHTIKTAREIIKTQYNLNLELLEKEILFIKETMEKIEK